MTEEPYKRILAWQRADELLVLVYQHTRTFPPDEKYGVTSQLRRAALSVVLNIVEGKARGTTKDLSRFLHMARGSIAETRYLIDLSFRLNYLPDPGFAELREKAKETNYLLQRLLEGVQPREASTSSTSSKPSTS